MFNINEKSFADNRTLLTIQKLKDEIDLLTKNGTIHYTTTDSNLWMTTPKIRKAYVAQDPNIRNYYDKLLIARDGVQIEDSYDFKDFQRFLNSVEIGKDLIVKGNFSVLGETSIIDTPTVSIEDNIIELNRNEKGSGITLQKAGTALNRGKLGFARYLFDDIKKGFVLDISKDIDDDITTPLAILLSENTVEGILGELKVKAKVSSPIGYFANSLTSTNLTSLNILNVSGLSTFNGLSKFNEPVSITKTLGVTGVATFNNNINVLGSSTLTGAVNAKDNLNIDGTLLTKGIATFNTNVNVKGDLNTTGAATFASTLEVTGKSTFDNDVKINAILTANSINAVNKITTPNLETEILKVTGVSELVGNVNIAGDTTLNSLTVKNASIFNGLVTANNKVNIVNSLEVKTKTDGSEGNIIAQGNISTAKNLSVTGTTLFTGAVTANNKITASFFSANTDYIVQAGNEKGLTFWNDANNKIYMSDRTNASGGSVKTSDATLQNIYIRTSGDRGFVFKNGISPLVQIDSIGNVYSKAAMYSKGSILLAASDMGHAPGAGKTSINADMVDGKHSTDILLRDGSQEMTGDLKLGNNRIRFSNDDYIYYNDDNFNVGSDTYGGKFFFSSDNIANHSIIEAGAFKAGNIGISGKTDAIVGVKTIDGSLGNIIRATDAWLRINDTRAHASGVYFGSSPIRTDSEIHIGNVGETLKISSSGFLYKGSNVITAAGGAMTGNLNFAKTKLTFGPSPNNTGTAGIAASDVASIYGEHEENTENSSLVIEIADNPNDSIVFRTSTSGEIKNDSLIINDAKATFKNNPYFGNNRLLHSGDIGPGAGLDADKLDGKHYSDIESTFVKKAGDTMAGKLTMNSDIIIAEGNKIQFNYANSFIGSGGFENRDVVLGSVGTTYFYPGADSTKAMKLETNGELHVLGSKVLTTVNYGHGKGIDADKLDGQHISDLDTRYVRTIGGTMTGNLNINKSEAEVFLSDGSNVNGRFVASQSGVYIQAGKTSVDTAGDLYLTGIGGARLARFNLAINDKAKATINGSQIITTDDYGTGKGIDADKLDGKHATDFATSTHNHNTQYVSKNEVDLKNKYKIQYNTTTDSLDFLYIS